jgi:hypothetical protein
VEFDIPAASGAFPGAHFGDVLPNLETLRRLIRHCGLELSFRLFNADLDEHDATLIAQLAQSFDSNQDASRPRRFCEVDGERECCFVHIQPS